MSVLGVLTGLPACAPLVAIMGYGNTATQIAVQIDRIKLASDGVSYLKSGKTVTDHAVSKIVGADCRLMNIVSAEKVCTPKKDDTQVAARDGRIVQIAYQKGSKLEIDLMPLMIKRLIHTGSTLRPRSVAEKAAIARALEEKVWPLLSSGRIRPQIHAVFPLKEASKAHEMLESSAHIGKIILNCGV